MSRQVLGTPVTTKAPSDIRLFLSRIMPGNDKLAAESVAIIAGRKSVSLCITAEPAFHSGVLFKYSPQLLLYHCGHVSPADQQGYQLIQ